MKVWTVVLLYFISSSAAVAYGESWLYRREVVINNTSGQALTDYQFKIAFDHATLVSAGKSSANAGDIRFRDSDGSSLLNYWIQEGSNTTTMIAWVKLRSVPAGSNKTIYLYYGNPGAVSQSNGDSTFLFFDSFEGNDLDTTKWRIQQNYTGNPKGSAIVSNSEVTFLSGQYDGSSPRSDYDFYQQTATGKTGSQRMVNKLKYPNWGGGGVASYYRQGSGGIDFPQSSVSVMWQASEFGYVEHVGGSHWENIFNPHNYIYQEVLFDSSAGTAQQRTRQGNIDTIIATATISVPSSRALFYHKATNWASTFPQGKIVSDWVFSARYTPNEPAVTVSGTEEVVGSGLVAFYPFNGNANDESGNSNHGIISGSTPETDRFGQINSAYRFDGADDYIVLPNRNALQFETADATVCAWIKTASTAYGRIVTRGECDGSRGWQLTFEGSKVFAGFNEGGSPPTYFRSNGSVNDNEWHFLVWSRKSNMIKLYVDGVAQVDSGMITHSITNSGSDLLIGRGDSPCNSTFQGMIDDIRIYTRALTQHEIDSLHGEGGYDPSLVAYYPFNGNANDESGNGHHGTSNGPIQSLNRFGRSSQALQFDGINDYVSLPSLPLQKNLSISFWIRTNSDEAENWPGGQFVVDRDIYDVRRDWSVGFGSGGRIQFNTTANVLTSATSVNTGVWRQIVVVRDADNENKKIYIDGELDTTASFGVGDFENQDREIFIGASTVETNSHKFFDGAIDDIRFYGRALSDVEIRSLYDLERVIDSTTLWGMDLTVSTAVASDLSNTLGIANDATDNFDPFFDEPEPPASPGDFVRLYFPHPEYDQATGDNFTRDIRAVHDLADTVLRFRFDVNANISEGAVSLSFSSDGRIPSGFGMVLKDLSSGARKNLKRDGMSYSFTSPVGGGTREFELLIGDSTAPSIAVMSPNGGEIIHANSDYSVLWMASDGTGVDSVNIDYSNDAGASFDPVSSVTGNAGMYDWTTPAEYLNSNAVLKIQATDSMGNSALDYSDRLFTIVGDSLSTNFSAGWNLVGTALDPTNADPTSLFADDISGAFYVFDFSQSGGYSHPLSFVHGRGYWLGLLADQSADIRGWAVTDTNVLNLPQGFTMISNPLVVPLPVDSLVFAVGDSTKAYAEAVSSGWIASGVQEYDNGTGSYASTDTLGIWQGAWLGVIEEDVQIIVTPPMLPAVGCDANAAQDSPSEFRLPRDWQVNIIAEGTRVQDRSLTFGVKPDASEGFDLRYDEPKPPVPPGGKYVQAFFLHTDWVPILGNRFTSDIQSPDGRKAWMFYVSASELMDITLRWDVASILRDVPDSVKLELTDMKSGEKIDMRSVSEHSFSTKDARALSINAVVLEAEGDRILPSAFNLKQAYPSPFNPSTTIEFALPSSEQVTLRIYNTLGEEVRTVIDEFKSAGSYSVQVDMNGLPSGVYLYRLQAGEFSEVKRMVLVR